MAREYAYLIFDCETVSDGRLLQRVRYPDEPQLTPAEAVARQRAELLEKTGSDFIPHTFQVPVSVAVALVNPDFSLARLATIDRPAFRPQIITRRFWEGWSRFGQPTLVTFNGRGFDLPVLELAAFRYGVPLPDWMSWDGPPYQQPRHRFNQQAHLDLQDILSAWGAARMNGGLDLLATLLGKPGKMGTKGHMVQDLWQAGEGQRIDDYCICDTLDTYFVFLRVMVLRGRIDLARERDLVDGARRVIEEKASEVPALTEYLEKFSIWEDPGEDGSPFVL